MYIHSIYIAIISAYSFFNGREFKSSHFYLFFFVFFFYKNEKLSNQTETKKPTTILIINRWRPRWKSHQLKK